MVKSFNKGTPVGEQKEFYPKESGKKEQQVAKLFCHDEDGNMDGVQKTFYPNGTLQASISYKKSELDGRKSLWNDQGVLLEEAEYKHGKLHGKAFQRLENGREIVCHYADGKKHGSHAIYFPLHETYGRVKALEASYVNDIVEGEVLEFAENGIQIAMTPYVAGKKEGIGKIFGPKGQDLLVIEFHNDQKHGPYKEYFPNGSLAKEANYIHDLVEGELRTYHPDGKLASLEQYKDGERNGIYQQWNEDGTLVFEAGYVHGKRHGKMNKYSDDGKLSLVQNFENDELHGAKYSYDADGQSSESFYDHGKKVR